VEQLVAACWQRGQIFRQPQPAEFAVHMAVAVDAVADLACSS
jgi:hypothetical protein